MAWSRRPRRNYRKTQAFSKSGRFQGRAGRGQNRQNRPIRTGQGADLKVVIGRARVWLFTADGQEIYRIVREYDNDFGHVLMLRKIDQAEGPEPTVERDDRF